MKCLHPISFVNEAIYSILDVIDDGNNSLQSIYLLGSFVDHTYIDSSDIDLCIITTNINDIRTVEKLIRNHVTSNSRHIFDLIVIDRQSFLDHQLFLKNNMLWRETILNIALSSSLVWGKELKNEIKLPSTDIYVKYTLPIPFEFISRIRNKSKCPNELTFPDTNDYYYGYTKGTNNLKLIISVVGWIATSLIAMENGLMIGKKSSVVSAYKTTVNDKWTTFIEDSFNVCRSKLLYKLPINDSDREELRTICENLLTFENYYLNICKNHNVQPI